MRQGSKEEVVRDEGSVDYWHYAIERDRERGVGRVIEWMVLNSGYMCDWGVWEVQMGSNINSSALALE